MTGIESRMLARFDHHDPALAKDGVPQRVYRELREKCPFTWSDAYEGFWVASRYADIEEVVRDPATFVSSQGILVPDLNDSLPPEDQRQRLESGRGVIGPPVSYDPPVHTEIRRKLEPLFSPAVVRNREDYIRSVADSWIDSFIADGECDVVAQFCAPVPAIVVLDWLGLDSGDWKVWSDAVLAQFSRPGEYGPDLSAIDLTKLLATLHDRRRNPADDIITAVAELEFDGQPFDDLELVALLAQLVFAGLDTTTNTTASTLVELYRHPDIRDELANTPQDDRLWASVIEEFLRYTCPIQGFKRTARTDATVADQKIQAGDRVYMLWASANFDEREFERPDEIDIRRTTNRHMTFGRGIHRCLGSHLARLEVKVMIQQILQRIPNYTVDEHRLQLHDDVGIAYGYESIPIAFAPRRGGGSAPRKPAGSSHGIA
ncbi:cytochrome P450 [Mycolicibacterium sp. XJ1819]